MEIFDLAKYGYTNRSILEDTFEDETNNIIEKEALKKYKETVKLIEGERQKLNEIKKQIESLLSSYAIDRLNTGEINKLNNDYDRITKQIESNEESLTWLENKFLQDVIERRKSELYRKHAGLALKLSLEEDEEDGEQAEHEIEKEHHPKEIETQKTQGNNFKHLLLQLVLMSLSLNFPLIMLNAPTWLLFLTIFFIFSPMIFVKEWLIFFVLHLYNILRVILYIWGIIVTAQGQQDFVAIAFYIVATLQSYHIIKNFIFTILTTILVITERNDK